MRSVSLALAGAILALRAPGAPGPPYAPADALAKFRIEPGFRIELVASEPLVQSPIAMDIDERGRWFVVEMPGYPVDTRPTGRIRLLEDTDGDGKPDRSTVFADNLVLPSGVMRWKKGVIVTSVPDVLYLEDTDGDGKADRREVLVTGFARTNPQHMVNTPLYGLDNWIYLAHEGPAEAVIYTDLFGDMGKPLTMPRFPDHAAVDADHRSVRFRPDSGQLESIAGRSQYGQAFDAWGRYFGSDNSNHIRLEMLAARYLRRNPEAPQSWGMADISDHGEAARVFPITERPTFELLTEAGEFTSACSLTPYTGDLFTGEYTRSTFVAEPVHNLVHRDVLEADGASYRARRGSEGREFLASTDAWFRPVSVYVGPDGALYVIDFYRKRIEHPEWTASEFQRNPSEFSVGADRGRIYRIVPDGPPVAYPRVELANAGNEALVEALSKGTLWWRRTAQRLLVERAAVDQAPALIALARDLRSAPGRLHALWTLDGLGRLPDDVVTSALGDGDPGVRENALQLAEPRLAASPALAAAVVARASAETDPRVRFQVLATLGDVTSAEATAAQARLLFAHLDDPWMQRAALSASPERASTYLERALDPASGAMTTDSPASRSLFHDLGALTGRTAGRDDLARLVGRAKDWWGAALLEGLAEGTRGRSSAVLEASGEALMTLAESEDRALSRAALTLLERRGLPPSADAALAHAEQTAVDRQADAARRADAIRLLAINSATSRRLMLERLVVPKEPEAVQVAALEALSKVRGDAVGRELLPVWPELTPGARSALVSLLLAEPGRQRLLVDALSHGTVQPWALSFWQKRDLLMNEDPQIRKDARALLEESPAQRGEVANRYAAAVEQGGDAGKGQQVFARVCAACHHLGGGSESDVGPDLATVRHRPPLSLLVDILSPSQSVAQGYETYMVELTNGRTEAGTLASQSATTITLRQAAKTIPILRRDIRRLTMVPQSIMPADLDKVITPAEMADLLAYITRLQDHVQ